MRTLLGRLFVFSILVQLLQCGLNYCAAQESSLDKSLSAVIRWMPANTQSVVIANGPFNLPEIANKRELFQQMSKMLQNPQQWWPSSTTTLQQIRTYCAVAQNFQDVAELYEHIREHKILCGAKVILESLPNSEVTNKNWRDRSCNVLVFESARSEQQSLLRLLAKVARSSYQDSGFQVFECATESRKESDKGLEKLDEFGKAMEQQYIAQGRIAEAAKLRSQRENRGWRTPLIVVCSPRPGVLVTSFGNREVVHKLLDRIRSNAPQATLLTSKPEWKFVNTRASIFGVRDFALAGANDPTSPRTKRRRGTADKDIDPQAEGFVLNLPTEAADLEYHYFSKSGDLISVFKQLFPDVQFYGDLSSKQFSTVFPGRVSTRVRFGSREGSSYSHALFLLGNKVGNIR